MNIDDRQLVARDKMVREQIAGRGIRDPLVILAMQSVPREQFVHVNWKNDAYRDEPLPIASNQTISQPYMVAYMAEALELTKESRVLEIGTGSGYAAAVLGQIAKQVVTIERIETLATQAESRIEELGYMNVHVVHADGTLGWPDQAPYDAILVSAGGPCIPESLKSQLKVGGVMVIPVGPDPKQQRLARIRRISGSSFQTRYLAQVRFVPLIGHEAWNEPMDESS